MRVTLTIYIDLYEIYVCIIFVISLNFMQPCAPKEIFDWWAELMRGKVVWNCVTAMPGALSVMTYLEVRKLLLPVGNSDSMETVTLA